MPDTKILVWGITPVSRDNKALNNKDIQDINIRIKQMCGSDVTYMNIYESLDNDEDIFASDGLHLNYEGYKKNCISNQNAYCLLNNDTAVLKLRGGHAINE